MASWHIGYGALLTRVARQLGPHVGASWLTVVACEAPSAETEAELRRGLAALRRRGTPIRMSSLVDPPSTLPERAVLVTFDGPHKAHLTGSLPLLEELGLKAVFFIPTDCLAERRLPDADRVAYLVDRCRRSRIALSYPLPLAIELEDRAAATALLQRIVASRYELDVDRFVTELAGACEVPWSPEIEGELADERLLTWDDVKALREAGMEVASLGASGRPFHLLTPSTTEAELRRAREALTKALGDAVVAGAAPLGHAADAPTSTRLFSRAGYAVAFGQRAGLTPLAGEHDPLALQRLPLTALQPPPSRAPSSRRRDHGLTLEVATAMPDLAALAPEWDALLARSAEPQVTRSAAWARAWWAVFGTSEDRELRVISLRRGGDLVAVVPLVRRPHWGARRLELIGSGEKQEDETCSEYLGVVVAPGEEQAVAAAMAEGLATAVGAWDELHLTNLSSEDDLLALLAEALAPLGEVSQFSGDACPYVPLPDSWPAYLKSKSSSRRQRLNRSMRRFERWTKGEHALHVVTTEPERRQAMRLLARLHEERWTADDKSGAFASSLFRDFHDRVSRHLLAAGRLDLTWLEVEGAPMAAQYSFVSGDRVQFYQSGRSTSVPSNIPIGIVLHLLNMQRAIELGHREYDFLAGISRYKMELAERLRPLYTLRVARSSLRGRVLDAGRQSVDWLRATRRSRANR